jgi:Xaa-Pro aminopeptidase
VELGVDALVVTSLPNVAYLTNFDGSAAIVVLTASRLYFITDFRYITATQDMLGQPHECPDLELVVVKGSYDATLAAVLASLSSTHIGFESANLTVSRYEWLRRALPRGEISGPELMATSGLVERGLATTTRSQRCGALGGCRWSPVPTRCAPAHRVGYRPGGRLHPQSRVQQDRV